MSSKGKPRRDLDQPAYKQARRDFLRQAQCHWCGGPANTIDHLIEIDRGADPMDQTLWVAACHRCNSRRGARYLQAKRAAQQAKRDSFTQHAMPPTPSFAVSSEAELAGTGGIQPELAASSSRRPRLITTGFDRDSYGPLVAAWAQRHMQVELMEWQRIALDGQLAHDDAGDLLAREALVSTARQQGKSVALRALIGWWVTEFAARRGCPQFVLSTANRLDRAESIFLDLAFILKEHFGGKLMQTHGRKSVTLPDGSRWEVRAASNKLHGGTFDLVVIDELFDVSESVLDEALRPSMIARKSPLLSCWSTAGDADSTAMIKMREEALGIIDRGERGRLFFAEWSMPPGVDPRDERFWHYPNPALDITVDLDALRAASTKDYFLRAHLNLWITARGAWLEQGTWLKAQTTEAMPAGGVLAVDSSLDDSRYVGVRAAQTDDGRTIVHTEFVAATEDDMWAGVQRVMADPKVNLLVTPSLEIHTPELLRRRATMVGYAELQRYTPTVRSMVLEGRLLHSGDLALSEHVCRAVLVKTAQGAVVSSQKSPGPIELCRVMILAASAASKPATAGRPMLVVA